MKALCIVYILLFLPGFGLTAQTDVRITTAVAWSPDGKTLAIGGRTNELGTIWLYDDLGTAISTIDLPTIVESARWSHDGSRLAARYETKLGTQLAIWDREALNTGTPSVTTEEFHAPSEGDQIVWSPTGHYIAADGSLWVYIIDTATGSQVAQLYDEKRTGRAGVFGIEWAADEQSVYVLYENPDANQLMQWDITTSQVVQTILSRASFAPISMQQSPDGQWLAVSEGHGSVFLLNAPGFEVERELLVLQGESHIPYVSHLFWSEDNTTLLGLADDGSAYLWDTTTGELIAIDSLIPDKGTYVRDVALTPFGGRLAMATTWYPETPLSTPSYAPTTYEPFLLGGMVRIAVPAPSLDRLNTITELCLREAATPNAPLATLAAQPVTESTLSDFVASVQALPNNAIPSACRTDLLAVAEALQSGS